MCDGDGMNVRVRQCVLWSMDMSAAVWVVILGTGAGSVGFSLFVFFFNDTATAEIYTEWVVGSVRCV